MHLIKPLCQPFMLTRPIRFVLGIQLAKRLKKHQSFVAKYEGGEWRIDVVEFLAITRAIGADPIRILKALQKHS